MSTYRLFPSTNGPTSPNSYGGDFIAGVAFTVTQPTMYLAGYWWWVCGSGGQSTAAQPFALWNDGGGAINQKLVSAGSITSAALTGGQWNYTALSTPIPLSENQLYIAATAFPGSFPVTNNSFGSGDSYAAGITNGPLFAYSDTGGSAPTPASILPQALFATGSLDPTSVFPGAGSNSANFWIDVQITDTAPASPTYRLFPSTPSPYGINATVSGNYSLAVEFKLSQACTVNKLWFLSPNGCVILPSRCGIWNVSNQTEVSGSDNSSPSWSGAAGSGWCYVDYTSASLTLPAGNYRAEVYSAGASNWFSYTLDYWSSGLGSTGVANGPISAPGNSGADTPGQGGSLAGSWGYPNSDSNGNAFWIDIEVTLATSSAINSGAFLSFFP